VVVGLGNPGTSYQQTRHNLGWIVLEHAARRWKVFLGQQGQAIQGQGAIDGQSVLLALPLIWMNQTGEVVHSILQKCNLSSSDLILVYDDLDLPLGTFKIKTRGGPGGHNGLRSVLSCLGTEEFCRVKVGIGRPLGGEDVARYVLSVFTQGEREQVNVVLPKVVDALECMMCQGVSVAMNRFHSPFTQQEVK